jgi:predicted DNA-binding protein YlxM (UPF0122 family)
MNMSKQEIINNIKRGDSILIDYTKELNKYDDEEDMDENETVNKLTLVLQVTEDKIKFKDKDDVLPFEMTKKYLLNSNLELKIIEDI